MCWSKLPVLATVVVVFVVEGDDNDWQEQNKQPVTQIYRRGLR